MKPDDRPLAAATTRERILRMLATSPEPLQWAELTGALGLLSDDVERACEWLMDHSYIAPIRLWNGATRSVEALWTLGDRGIAWARANGALGRSDRGENGARGARLIPLTAAV